MLLLGDSLGDLTMADGVAEPRNILTVGFLNDLVRPHDVYSHNGIAASDQCVGGSGTQCLFCFFSQVEERKETYVNSFDIVLVKEETMDVPNAILGHITSSSDK